MPFTVGPLIPTPDPGTLVPGSVTGSLGFVMRHATSMEKIILQRLASMVQGRHRYVEVKLRCKELVAGQFFCANPRPHFDSTRDTNRDGRPEVHHLFTTPPTTVFHALNEDCEHAVISVPEGYAVTYGRYSLHQTPRIHKPCTRLMIRISETDFIVPRNTVEGR